MMNGPEKSDPAIVAGKSANKAGSNPQRSRWSKGRGPRGMRASPLTSCYLGYVGR